MRRFAAILLSAALAGPAALAQTPPAGPAAAPRPAPPAATRGQVVEGAVATVNDQVISQSDVRNRMKLLLLGFQGQRDEQVIQEVQRQATEDLIKEKLQVQEFKEMLKSAKIEPEEIDQEIGRIARNNNMTADAFTSGLKAQGISVQSLRDKVEADLAWQTLIGARYGRQVRVSDQRIDEQLQRLKDSADEEQYRLAEIFLYAPDTTSRANAMTRAGTLKTQIEQGADFAQIAQQFSAAPSASSGGDLGFMTSADMRPEVKDAVLKSTPPTVLDPIESEGGIYLVAVLGKRAPLDANAVTLDIKQVIARGADAEQKVNQVKAAATTCAQAIAETPKVEGVTIHDMNGVGLEQVTDPAIKAALQPVQADQSTAVLDAPDGKMVLYVCKREQGGGLPSRQVIRNQLFDKEIGMLADRYLRDIRREATVMLR